MSLIPFLRQKIKRFVKAGFKPNTSNVASTTQTGCEICILDLCCVMNDWVWKYCQEESSSCQNLFLKIKSYNITSATHHSKFPYWFKFTLCQTKWFIYKAWSWSVSPIFNAFSPKWSLHYINVHGYNQIKPITNKYKRCQDICYNQVWPGPD